MRASVHNVFLTSSQTPTFDTPSPLLASVRENAPAGTPFGQVRARDGDSGRNGEVHYLLEDSRGGRFSVGRVDGVLRAEAPLDREAAAADEGGFQLAVVATDNGSPR